MILAIEFASVLLGLALIVAAAVIPEVAARLRQNEEWIEENNWLP